MKLKERAAAIKILIPALFIALKKPETPLAAKVFAGLAVAYALSPIDLVPDFIPLLGYLDDLIILPLLASLAIRLIPSEIMEASKAEASNLWQDGKPKKWYFALPIILFYMLILVLVIKAFL